MKWKSALVRGWWAFTVCCCDLLFPPSWFRLVTTTLGGCLFLWPSLLWQVWVRLVTAGTHWLSILVTLSLYYNEPVGMWRWIITVCSFLWPFLFRLVELALWWWAFDILFIVVTLSLLPVWVRLVTRGTHCLFIFATFSLPSGWVRLWKWRAVIWQIRNQSETNLSGTLGVY